MDFLGLNIDFTVAVAVIGITALALHYKSHLKFVALGVFIGLVLLELIPFNSYFVSPGAESLAQIVVLVIPAIVLGVNHAVDKRKKGSFVWKIIFALVFTLFFLSSVAQVLPLDYRQLVMDRSIVGWQVIDNHAWFTLAAAVFIMIDSVMHRHAAEKAKKKKSKKD